MGDKGMQQGGVPILMSVRTKRALMEWMQICMRTIKARFYSKQKLTVIKAYAPTDDAMDEEKDEFYNQLRDSVASCSSHNMILMMGDLNAYGSNNINREEVLRKFSVGVMNDNGKGYVTSVVRMA